MLIALLGISLILILFSDEARIGAYQGLVLAQNTIIPSLLPLLIIFLLIMKTSAKDVLAKAFGFISGYLFNLPMVTLPAIFFGMIGGYPTGALMTAELFDNEEIDSTQAQTMLCFNFCGGCGFIITAVGCGILQNQSAGIILFVSCVISNTLIGTALSFGKKRKIEKFYSYNESIGLSDAMQSATSSAIQSVLNITAFVILFSAFNSIITLPDFILPIVEITNGVCRKSSFSLPELSAYLSFGGLCIHMQLLPIILKCKMKYSHFLMSRFVSALLSYCITKLLLLIFPLANDVFSNSDSRVAVFSSVNVALSFLMIAGCFVLVLDLNSKKRTLDR